MSQDKVRHNDFLKVYAVRQAPKNCNEGNLETREKRIRDNSRGVRHKRIKRKKWRRRRAGVYHNEVREFLEEN